MNELNKKALGFMEEKLNHHKMLAKYTKKTTKLNKHLFDIRFMEEVIDDYKQGCGLY